MKKWTEEGKQPKFDKIEKKPIVRLIGRRIKPLPEKQGGQSQGRIRIFKMD